MSLHFCSGIIFSERIVNPQGPGPSVQITEPIIELKTAQNLETAVSDFSANFDGEPYLSQGEDVWDYNEINAQPFIEPPHQNPAAGQNPETVNKSVMYDSNQTSAEQQWNESDLLTDILSCLH